MLGEEAFWGRNGTRRALAARGGAPAAGCRRPTAQLCSILAPAACPWLSMTHRPEPERQRQRQRQTRAAKARWSAFVTRTHTRRGLAPLVPVVHGRVRASLISAIPFPNQARGCVYPAGYVRKHSGHDLHTPLGSGWLPWGTDACQ